MALTGSSGGWDTLGENAMLSAASGRDRVLPLCIRRALLLFDRHVGVAGLPLRLLARGQSQAALTDLQGLLGQVEGGPHLSQKIQPQDTAVLDRPVRIHAVPCDS
ncbi:UNVERIFIED_CONTAM: hypothetical protein FKN15_066543 [Acipenser sinensis]